MLLLAVALCRPAAAAAPPEVQLDETMDPQQIEEGEPVTLQDDVTNDPGELSVQYSGTYLRSQEADSKEVLEQGATLKLGLFKDVQVSVNPNYDTGRESERNSGEMMSDVLVHFADQTRLLPAFAFDLFYSLPFGAGRKSAATIFRAIASHSLGTGENAPRLHFNLNDVHLVDPGADQRKDQLQIVFGGSFLPSPSGALVADIVYGAAEEKRGTQTFLEMGYTRVLPHAWTVELGIGRQVAGAANALRVFFSVEKEVHVF
jgi:hypothetical protein